jgi:omega-6 fatty acid desaturase (delta-12 desaturase)
MGHNSFLPNRKANKLLGFILGVIVLTPAEQWWHSHAIHHATSGNLSKRGFGDVTTLTVDEFITRQWSARLGYKLFRHPLVMFGLGPLYMFLIAHRLALPRYGKKETNSVIITNLALLAIAVGVSLLIGWQNLIIIQLGVLLLGGSAGIWLFYVQHQFEEVYWASDEEWNYVASALLGASYYKLPKVLQWFTGNIGFHHIHHLSPRIPNYNLEKCHNSNPIFSQYAPVLTLSTSFKSANLRLIDVDLKRMVGFAHLRRKSSRAAGQPEKAEAR